MANDLEQLVLSISADTRQIQRALKKLEGDSNASTKVVERRFDSMGKRLDGTFAGIGKSARTVFAGLLAGVSINEYLRLADTWTELKSRVDLAAGSIESGTEVMGRLGEMARRTYSDLQQTADSYLANATTLTELGYSTQTQLDYTEALNNALVISAAKGDRARSVMDALSKAMALGKLSGDNLNTVIASGGRVAEALASSMGVTTLQLRKLGADGKITRTELIGITKELSKLREEADSMQATLGDAATLLRNAALQYVGAGDQAIGVSRQLAEAVILVADNFGTIADAAVQLGFVISSALISKALGGMITRIPLAVSALGTMVTAMRAGTLTAAAFSATLGPIALVAGGAAAALYLFTQRQSEADIAAEKHESALKTLKQEIEGVDYANQDAVASTRTKIAADLKAAEVALERAQAEYELAEALQATLDKRASASSNARTYTGFGVDTSKVKTGGQDVVAQNIVTGQIKTATDKVEVMRQRVDEIKALTTEFDDYASGRKKPPGGGDKPILEIPGDDKASKDREKAKKAIDDVIASLRFEQEQLARNSVEQRTYNELKRAGVLLNTEAGQKIADLVAQIEAETQTIEANTQAQEKRAESMENLFDMGTDALTSIADGSVKAEDALKKLVLQLALAAVQASLLGTGPLAGLFGSFKPTTGGFASMLGIPGYAKGTSNHPGGMAIVGEKGPELLNLPRGSQVIPNVPRIPKLASSGGSRSVVVNFSPVIDARGADAAAVARIERGQQKMAAEMKATVVQTVREANSKNVKFA